METEISLQKKLALLKESYESKVIDEEEYLRNKEQVEKKLASLKQQNSEEKKEQDQPIQSAPQSSSASKTNSFSYSSSRSEEENSSDDKGEQEQEPQEQKSEKESREEERKNAQKERSTQNTSEDHHLEDDHHHPKKESHFLAISLWILGAIALLSLLLYASFTLHEKAPEIEWTSHGPMCESDLDCKKNGAEFKCINPSTEKANCTYQANVQAKLLILTSGNCPSCDTLRVEGIIKGWFPASNTSRLESTTPEGEALMVANGIVSLPAYLLEKRIDQSWKFDEVKSAFRLSGDLYILKEGAAAPTYYPLREEQRKKVDLFLSPDEASSEKAIRNFIEFDSLMDGEAKVTVRISKENNFSEQNACVALTNPKSAPEYFSCIIKDSSEKCIGSLGINKAQIDSCIASEKGAQKVLEDIALLKSLSLERPSLLINNQIKLLGVQSAESVKKAYCDVNPSQKCATELKKNLI